MGDGQRDAVFDVQHGIDEVQGMESGEIRRTYCHFFYASLFQQTAAFGPVEQGGAGCYVACAVEKEDVGVGGVRDFPMVYNQDVIAFPAEFEQLQQLGAVRIFKMVIDNIVFH